MRKSKSPVLRQGGSAVGVLCLALSLGTSTAWAGTGATGSTEALAYDAIVYTDNDSAVASVSRWAGWELAVCDEARDGMRARAELINLSTGKKIAAVEDASGSADDYCGEGNAYPAPFAGQRLQLKVWVQDGAGGIPRFDNQVTFTA
jgi:hypothetical protein